MLYICITMYTLNRGLSFKNTLLVVMVDVIMKLNIILGVSLRVFLDEFNIDIGRLSKADDPP